MSEFTFTCPTCGKDIAVNQSYAGTTTQCPNCSSNILVPMQGISEGMEIAGFKIERRLGIGGMGEVWLARQTAMDRLIALKILSPALTQNIAFVNRFTEEVKTSAKLEHPNIVTAHHAGVEDGIYFLAMTYVDGIVLEDRLTIDNKLPEQEALRLVRSIAEALCYAWNKFKIIHRDIKPANIMIDSDGNARLMDMGISKSMSENKSLTMTGVVVGTPYYMSPEQARAEDELDCRSDIYSMGATLYHMVTGGVPYEGNTSMGVLTKHITDPFPPPRNRNPELSDHCSKLLETMMAKKPEDRQQNWENVITDIDLTLKGESPLGSHPHTGSLDSNGTGTYASRETLVMDPDEKPVKTHDKSGLKKIFNEIFLKKRQIYLLIAVIVAILTAFHFYHVNTSQKKKMGIGPEKGKNWTVPDLDMEMIYVKGGEFMMGSNEGKKDEKPVHKVRITKPFWIGKYEVTQTQYKEIMRSNPSYFRGKNYPVECVSWNDAVDFCKKLTEREDHADRLPNGYVYCLPTEAEWEYVARGGLKNQNCKYSGSNKADEVAWYYENSGDGILDDQTWDEQKREKNSCRTHPIGRKKPNELGIHDMSGNVWEWCGDFYTKDYYSKSLFEDPKGYSSGPGRVGRGGSWYGLAKGCRVSNRCYVPPSFTLNSMGFRVALALDQR